MQIKNNNKFNNLIIYYLCFILILSFLSVLAGCAPVSALKDNNGNEGFGGSTGYRKKLENKVLTASLRLTGVSKEKIKTVITYNVKTNPVKKNGGGGYYIDPFFMKGESNIINTTTAKNFRIALNKTTESRNGKIILRILSVKSEKIFEIISFSLANLYPSPVKYRPSLLEKADVGGKYKYIGIPFKSNIETGSGGKNYFTLQGLSEIKGKIIFLKNRNKPYEAGISGLALGISALRKSRFGGGINFLKLFAKL